MGETAVGRRQDQLVRPLRLFCSREFRRIIGARVITYPRGQ
jgi:hypothetical protein